MKRSSNTRRLRTTACHVKTLRGAQLHRLKLDMGASSSHSATTWQLTGQDSSTAFFLSPLQPFTLRTKSYTYKQLEKKGVIADSAIPAPQQSKVSFDFIHQQPGQFECKARIKTLPGFSRDFSFEVQSILNIKWEDGDNVYDTDRGLELNIVPLLDLLSQEFFGGTDINQLYSQFHASVNKA